MKCIFLLPFFLATTIAINSKSVNFALQTSFLFDPRTANKDISFITNLRRFLGKLEAYISPKKFLRTNEESNNLLSDFLRNFAEVIINYEGDEVQEFAKALDGEMEEYYYTGTIFHQIAFDPKLKTFLRNSIKEWTVTDPDQLKYQLEFYLNSTKNNKFDNFIKVLDRFYGEKDKEQLNTIISNITKPKPLQELSEIIKEALKFIIFDRYETLNYTSKAILAEEIGKLTEYVAENYESKVKDAEAVFTYKRNLKNDTFSNDLLNKNTNVDSANAVEKQHRTVTKVIKEILLNKNIEIDVRKSDKLEKKESETTTGAATIIFRSEDNPGVTNVVNLADLLWEHGTENPDVENLNFKLKL